MIGKEVYKIYAPKGAKWVEWVRPVPFVAMDTYNRVATSNWVDRKAIALQKYQKDTAIFIDLLAKESIEMSIDLASIGYRPIPLFNGSEKLKNIKLEEDANPTFLLDSSRVNRYREKESIFDNSWDLYKQDIPSSEYFKQNGITKIIVIGEEINSDLKKIFLEFQKDGIEFFLTDGYSSIKKVILKKTLKEQFMKEEL